jgi:ferritin-like metal-binding protein YciE
MVISMTTKKADKDNLTTRINQPLMETEEDDFERLEPVTKRNGETLQ